MVRRCGGAYGGKGTKAIHIAAAAALAAVKLKRYILSIELVHVIFIEKDK